MGFFREQLPSAVYVTGTAYGMLYSGVMLNSSIFLIPALTDPEKTPSQRVSAAQIIHIMMNVAGRSTSATNISGIAGAALLLGAAYASHIGVLRLSPTASPLLTTGAVLVAATLPYQVLVLQPYVKRMKVMEQQVLDNKGGLGLEDMSNARKQEAVETLQGWAKSNLGKVALCLSGSLLAIVAAAVP